MFVEEIDGTIVAAARINKEQVPEYADARWTADAPDGEVMGLHALVVSPKNKGKGYGTAFVDFYEKYALENGSLSQNGHQCEEHRRTQSI